MPRLLRVWQHLHPEDRVEVVEGTLVSADISGFTRLSEQLASLGKEGAEELTDLLNECFDAMIDICVAHIGDVLKFGGDALLVLFTGANHAERACRAALGMRASVKRPLLTRSGRTVRLRISIGAHSGPFNVFLLDAGHRELIVTGPTATRTVLCEAEAAAGEILVTESTAALLGPGWRQTVHPHGRLLQGTTRAHQILRLDEDADGDGDGVGVGDRHDGPAAEELWPLVPQAQREQIAVGGDGEHRQVTVAFLKFSGTDDAVEEEGPGVLAARLQTLADVVREATARHAVHWLASDVYPDGGKIIIAGGAPVSAGDDEERVLRAVRQILDEVTVPTLRAGVHQGHVFVGNLGSRKRRTFTVMGDAVNLAARLMQKAEPGQLVASERVLSRVRAGTACVPLAPFVVKGKAAPIHAAVVEAVTDADPDPAQSRLPLIGRQEELAELASAVDEARRGAGRCVELHGEAGIGKTRLLDELAGAGYAPVVTAWCQPYLSATPYGLMRRLLRPLVGVEAEADRAAAGQQLHALVMTEAPDLTPWLPLVAVAIEADVATTPSVDALDPRFWRSKMHEVVVDLLARVVRSATIIRVEDVHWIDDASRDLLDEMARAAGTRPWLLCVTTVPDQTALSAPQQRLAVGPLDHASTRELAAAALGNSEVVDSAGLDLIATQSGGHPLFTIELVAAAVARGSVDTLPESVESAITSRMDTLRPDDRALVRDASVLGVRFALDELAAAFGQDMADRRRWSRLTAVATIGPDSIVTFRHALLHRVAYEGLAYKRRRWLHRKAGEAVERRAVAAGDPSDLLSLHFWRAEDHERAWRYSLVAGERAQRAYANVEAAEYYRRALSSAARVAAVSDDEVARVAEALGDVCERGGFFDDAMTAYRRARKATPRGDDVPRLLRKQGVVRERLGAYRDALTLYGRALAMLADAADQTAQGERADLEVAYAGVRFRQGRYRDCDEWASRAARDADISNHREALAHALYLRDHAETFLGDKRARDDGDRALAIFVELEDHVGQANVLNNMGVTAYYEGRWDDALALYGRSREHRERAGDVIGAATAVNNIAEILSDQGDLDEAIAMFKEARREFAAHHYPLGAAVATNNLGRAHARAGRTAEALELLQAARGAFVELHAAAFAAEAAYRQAECLLLAGRATDALEATQTLLAHDDGDPVLRVGVLRVRAAALLRIDDLAAARAMIDEALQLARTVDAGFEQDLCLGVLRDIDNAAERY